MGNIKEEFTKVVNIDGRNINFKIDLNYRRERRFNGKTTHRITVNDMGFGSFYKVIEVDAKDNLKLELEKIENSIKEYYGAREISKTEICEAGQQLIDLGFK